MRPSLISELFLAFCDDVSRPPSVSLRGGNAIDDHATPMPFDSELDKISDDYFERFHWGLSYLTPDSWRHYLPHLFEYSFHRLKAGSVVIDALLNSLRPPERNPARLGSINKEQEHAIKLAVEHLAFAQNSAQSDLACQVLEEWWWPNAIYRNRIE